LKVGDIQVHIPSDRGAFDGEFDFSQSKGFILHVSAGVDIHTGAATWLLEAIDPATGEVIQGALNELLGAAGSTTDNGFISSTIKPKDGLATGTQITAQARVLFDTAAPEDTQKIRQPIDGVAPTTTLTAAPITAGSADYQVTWNAVDDPGGSGVRGVTVYVA